MLRLNYHKQSKENTTTMEIITFLAFLSPVFDYTLIRQFSTISEAILAMSVGALVCKVFLAGLTIMEVIGPSTSNVFLHEYRLVKT